MPNLLGPTGLQTATRDEILAQYTAAMQSIFGPNINLDPDSPDGQMLNIFAQSVLDLEDLLTQIYNQFDPDLAIGKVLDQRVAINGIQRIAGTYTLTNVTITVNQSVNFYGLDQTDQPVYTVADNAGNNWKLITTSLGLTSGAHVLAFRAENPGAVLTVPNTITVPVTIVLGVTAINNPTTYTTLGINEETDAQLKVRRQQSVALSSQGYLAGLLAALENISGMTSVTVLENVTGTTDGDGIPGHSIWVIVSGTASVASIANAIYNKRNAGCGMKGTQTFVITQPDGSSFVIRWDNVSTVNLFIKFTASSLDGVNAPDYATILSQLPQIFIPGVYQQVNINDLATLVQEIDKNALITSAGFSTSAGGSYTNTLTPAAKNNQFTIASANIIILPILVTPSAPSVAHGATQQFSSVGGNSTITWSIPTNNSGGSINSSTGLYTAGATHPVTDVVRATDALGNLTNVNVSVT